MRFLVELKSTNNSRYHHDFAIALKALALWFLILLLAILNGLLREKVLIPAFGIQPGFIASGFLLCMTILLVAYIAVPWYGGLCSAHFWLIGLFWFFLTLFFEFGFGRFVQSKAWTELLEAYTFNEGNLWPLVLLVTALAPWVTARLRGLV